ncbi:TPA: hypothetical protein ACGN81_003899 [Bacillus cereus]
MKIWALKSVLDNYESFQLLNFEEDNKKYIDGKINSITHLANSWGNIYIECIEGDIHSDFPKFWGGTGAPMISEKAVFKKLITGLIIGCEKFAFNSNTVQNEMIFKVYINGKIHPTAVFISDELKNLIEQSDLKGFEFIEVWDSEELS